MKTWLPRIIVGVCFVAVLALPVVYQSDEPAEPDAGEARRLVIMSPHNEQIQHEFGRAFSLWHDKRFGERVEVDWRDVGGTSDMRRIILSQLRMRARQGIADEGIGVDLIFGGGDYEFEHKFKPGVTVPMRDDRGEPLRDANGEVRLRRVSALQPVELDPNLMRHAFATARIADKKLYDPEGYWYGAVLSSFGIVYNRDVVKLLGLNEPTTWADLADPRYYGNVALADPAHSGSIRVTYDAILQRYGWARGVRTLRRVFANARYFAPGASKVPVDVTSGEAAAGMCIDFYGRFQAQTVGPGKVVDGPRAGYVAPNGATVVTADPIGMVRGAPSPTLARRFIEFVLSRQGQALWNFHVGAEVVAPDGTVLRGPDRFALRRSPIRRDMYAHFTEHMADPVNPYHIARALPEGTPSYFMVLPDLLHAMCMDIHEELKAAWRAIGRTEDPELRRAMLKEFDAMPFTAEQLLEEGGGDDKRRRWTAFFRAKYETVVQMAGGGPTESPSTTGE